MPCWKCLVCSQLQTRSDSFQPRSAFFIIFSPVPSPQQRGEEDLLLINSLPLCFSPRRSPVPRDLPASSRTSRLWVQRQRAVEGLGAHPGLCTTEAPAEPRLLPRGSQNPQVRVGPLGVEFSPRSLLGVLRASSGWDLVVSWCQREGLVC